MSELAHAYVAQGANGLTKVGFTRYPDQRIKRLRVEFRTKGDTLERFTQFDAIELAFFVELSLISYCDIHYQKHSGREWFLGADFDTLVKVGRAATETKRHQKKDPPLTDEERLRRDAKFEAERAAFLEGRRAQDAYNARRSAEFQHKRHKSERVIGSFVSFVLGQQPAQA